MTRKELSQLYHLNREIEDHEAERGEIEAALHKMAANYATTVTGSTPEFPYTQHTIRIGGVPVSVASEEAYFEKRRELQEIKRLVELKKEQCFVEYGRLMRYINGIPDSLTRRIVKLRFVNGLPWQQVAASVGGNNTADGVRMICNRFIDAEQ